MRRILDIGLPSVLVLSLLTVPTAAQSPVQVDCTGDPAALVAAITAASPGDTLVISGTCASDSYEVSKDLTIKGGSDRPTISASSRGQDFSIRSATVELVDLTMTLRTVVGRGNAPGSSALLRDVVATRSVFSMPGAGPLTIVDSVLISDGTTDPVVGCLGGSTLTVRNSTVVGTNQNGMGIVISSDDHYGACEGTLEQVTVTHNGNAGISVFGHVTMDHVRVRANTGGGGISNFGRLVMRDSVVSRNVSGSGGGGISNFGRLVMRDSVVSGNVSGSDGGGILNGTTGFLTLSRVTITGNLASGTGGGIRNDGGRTGLHRVTLRDNDPNRCTGC